ncbi:hypothetical protein AB0B88_15905 [Micromonospora haikouensis]|uniref:hypothetical protein n=1 Tax=Micromonospora haikouensis TaxID=686309 RepID=UPI0033E3F962
MTSPPPVPPADLYAPDLAYTAAAIALDDAAADIGDGTVITALRPAVAAGVAVTAAAPHIRAHTLEVVADLQARSGMTRWATVAAAGPAAALTVLAVWGIHRGEPGLVVLAAAAVLVALAGVAGMLGVDARVRSRVLVHLAAVDRTPPRRR